MCRGYALRRSLTCRFGCWCEHIPWWERELSNVVFLLWFAFMLNLDPWAQGIGKLSDPVRSARVKRITAPSCNVQALDSTGLILIFPLGWDQVWHSEWDEQLALSLLHCAKACPALYCPDFSSSVFTTVFGNGEKGEFEVFCKRSAVLGGGRAARFVDLRISTLCLLTSYGQFRWWKPKAWKSRNSETEENLYSLFSGLGWMFIGNRWRY